MFLGECAHRDREGRGARSLRFVVSTAAYVEAARRVELACSSVTDARTLRLQLVAEIQRAVGFDAYVWVMTDPETSVGSAPLADVPPACLPRLPQLIRLKYLTEVNRWTQLGDLKVAVLSNATEGELSRSRLWREMLREYGVVDVASGVFSDRFGCWGFLDLWRTGDGARFGPDETAFLARIATSVTTALRRSQAQTFAISDVRGSRPPGPAVLLLSGDLEVLAQTPETEEFLHQLIPSPASTPVPAGAYNVAAQLLAGEQGVDQNSPTARVHVADGLWMTLRAARIGKPTPLGDRNIAVTIEQATPNERLDLYTRAFALGARERELLGHLVGGCDTRGLALRMSLSEHTVQDHLKSIFSKTTTNSRKALLSQVLGT